MSLWVRDLPCPERFRYVHNERRYEGLRKFNEARSARHAAESVAAASEIGQVSAREVLIAGAIAYWCEGANPKTHRTNVGQSYHGCLRVDVRRSGALYRKIEGWASAAMTPGGPNAAQGEPVSWSG